jgi:hypothetical protein
MQAERISAAPAARSREEYLARIPLRIAELISGREEAAQLALEAGDLTRLEHIAGSANRLRIDGRPVGAEEVEIEAAPTLEKESAPDGGPTAGGARRALEDLLGGRVVGELFFAGAATRFSEVAGGPLYFLDVWEVARKVLSTEGGGAPAFAAGMDPQTFRRLREEVREAAALLPPERRLRLPLGPRILLSYRVALAKLARQAGEDPREPLRRARLVIHLPESEDGQRMLADLKARRFSGFDPQRVLLVFQPCFGGWKVAERKVSEKNGPVKVVEPIEGSRQFPYGHGYSTLQLVQPGAAARFEGEVLAPLNGDVLSFLGREGDFILRTHRVNDLTQLSAAILDLDRLAAARRLVDRGHAVIIELVANPGGQKGGNWLRRKGTEHRFLIEGLSAQSGGWPEFLEKHRGAPYNAFRNIYDGAALQRILLDHSLPDHLRIRKLGPSGGKRPPLGLYLESVTGDLTQIAEARAAAFRASESEEIQDLKELKDLAGGVRFVAAQDLDEELRRAAAVTSV